MRNLAIASLALVMLLMSLSAYLRLDQSGIGCKPWPACYGNIDVAQAEVTVGDAYERLLEEAQQPLGWARPTHRLVASILGMAILALALLSLVRQRDRILAFSLLFLTVFLAWLGIYSEGLSSPAVVMGNLAGGFVMLGLLGWMVFAPPSGASHGKPLLGKLAIAALALLSVQILFGGLTSANFAASACQTVPDCHGSWLPGRDLAIAFDIGKTHEIGENGTVLGGNERADIHKLHRLTAVLSAALIVALGIAALRAGPEYRFIGSLLIVLVLGEFSIGVAAILTELPIALAVAHNGLAALLLLNLMGLTKRAKPESRPL